MSMTDIVGGLRVRLIKDSFFYMIEESLAVRGWFDPGRQHMPVNLVAKSQNWDEPVQYNTLAISVEDVQDDEQEMGSNLTEDRWQVYVDFFAEDDALGMDLTNDIRDILRGKMGSIGRGRPSFTVFDYRQATPNRLFRCGIENVISDRARNFPRPWQQHWYVVRCDVLDTYSDDGTEWIPPVGEDDWIGGY